MSLREFPVPVPYIFSFPMNYGIIFPTNPMDEHGTITNMRPNISRKDAENLSRPLLGKRRWACDISDIIGSDLQTDE